MKVTKWLRTVFLFPAMLMFGIEGEAETQDAGADPDTTTAEASGTQEATTATDNTAGAAPATESAEVQDGQEEGTSEGAPATTDKAAHQTTMEERVQALVEKRTGEVESRLRAEMQATTQTKAQERPNFVDVDMDRVNDHIRNTMDQIEVLKIEGRYDEARKLSRGLDRLDLELESNDQRKGEFVQRSQAQQQNAQVSAQMNAQIEQASALVAKEHSITPEVWKAGEAFFKAERAAKPLIDAQYREKCFVQGPVAAMLWAKDYVSEHMGEAQKAATAKKEAAKAALPGGKTSASVSNGKDYKAMSDDDFNAELSRVKYGQ